jgi:hypothetical protein
MYCLKISNSTGLRFTYLSFLPFDLNLCCYRCNRSLRYSELCKQEESRKVTIAISSLSTVYFPIGTRWTDSCEQSWPTHESGYRNICNIFEWQYKAHGYTRASKRKRRPGAEGHRECKFSVTNTSDNNTTASHLNKIQLSSDNTPLLSFSGGRCHVL